MAKTMLKIRMEWFLPVSCKTASELRVPAKLPMKMALLSMQNTK